LKEDFHKVLFSSGW